MAKIALTDYASETESIRAAAERALSEGLTLGKYADPTEDGREGLTADEAADVGRVDASLVYVDTTRVTRLSPEDSAILRTADALRSATMTEDETARSAAEAAEEGMHLAEGAAQQRIDQQAGMCRLEDPPLMTQKGDGEHGLMVPGLGLQIDRVRRGFRWGGHSGLRTTAGPPAAWYANRGMLKLKRLKVQKYRIVKPGVELAFHEGINVLLGVNGTGKTTLLDLATMIFSANFAGLEDEEFDLDYEFLLPEGSLSIRVRNEQLPSNRDRQPEYSPTIWLTFQPSLSDWVAIQATVSRSHLLLECSNGEERIEADISPFKTNFIFRIFDKITRGSHLAISQDQWMGLDGYGNYFRLVTRFDEKASFSIEKRTKNTGYLASAMAMLPGEFWLKVKEQLGAHGRTSVLSFTHSDLDFLGKAVAALGYRTAEANLDLKSSTEKPDDPYVALEFGNLRFYFTKHDGSRIPLDRLSYGQKRLFAYFYYLALHEQVVVADELANGMHHAMIDDCLEAIGPRQAFLATQNPLLLDHMGFENSEDVRRSFVLCETRMESQREAMVWSSMTEADASEFYKDYLVGIQHTNDILRLRGLW